MATRTKDYHNEPIKERPLHEIREIYKDEINAMTAEFCAIIKAHNEAKASAFIPEVIVNLGRRIAQTGQRLVCDLSDFIDCAASVILEPSPAYAYALNRGVGEINNLPQKASLSKKGNGCELKIEIELADKDATVVLGLLDENGNSIDCFNVEFTDAESGESLKRSATQGTLRFKNVLCGKYRIAASTEKQSCEFTLSIV